MIFKKTKIEIPCVNRCLNCGGICKINQSKIDNEKNLLILEWICDCGYMYETTENIKYI